MHTIGVGPRICPARRIVLQEGETSPLGVIPIEPYTACLDMGCGSVVNCVQFYTRGWCCHSSIGH